MNKYPPMKRSAEQWEKIMKACQRADMSVKEVSEYYQVTGNTIRKYEHLFGIRLKRVYANAIWKQKLEQFDGKATSDEIAEALHYTVGTVRHFLKVTKVPYKRRSSGRHSIGFENNGKKETE